jgi:2-oxoglutarate dehydrogenase E2 component (dihydrolipoamide succinyltransferase)
MAELTLPRFGVGMESGVLTDWNVSDGERVAKGEVVALIATDKSEVELEAPATGVIRLLADIDNEYEIGTVLARIEEEEQG